MANLEMNEDLMKMKVLVMYSGFIDIEATKDRDSVQGVSLEYYFFGNDGERVKPKLSVDGISGTRRGKSFLSPELECKVQFIPGIYEGSFIMNVGSDGNAKLKLVDLDYIAKASIVAMDEKKEAAK